MVTPSTPVVIYSTTWCGSCKTAKKYFSSRGIPFEEIDIDGNREAAEAVMGWAGGCRTVPTMIIGKSIVVDWDRKAVVQALAESGWLEPSNP